MSAGISVPPDECPAHLQDKVDPIDLHPKQMMRFHKVAWSIQAKLGGIGYTTLADLADLYESFSEVKTNAPKELDYEATSSPWSEELTKLHSMRLWHAIQEAKTMRTQQTKGVYGLDAPPADIITAGVRDTLEQAYMTANKGERPPLKYQGSDHYMGLQYKECQRGSIGWFTERQIVGKIPDLSSTVTRREERKRRDGSYVTEDTETREPPHTWMQWKEMTKIFQTTLLMCTAGNPQHANIQITREQLDEFYDFLEGDRMAQNPAHRIPLQTLRKAEREVWRRVCLALHNKESLPNALRRIQGDWIFWTPFINGSHTGQERPQGSQKGKGRGKDRRQKKPVPDTAGWEKPSQSQKGAGRGKGSERPKRNTWLRKDTAGKEYCFAYNSKGCSGDCNRLHRCCRRLANGSACNGKHKAQDCTRT